MAHLTDDCVIQKDLQLENPIIRHGFIALLPRIQFKHLRVPEGYPEKLENLGDHLRARRLDRNQKQKEVAKLVEVTVETLLNWELGRSEVSAISYPAVADYLGYCLVPDQLENPSLGKLVRRHRHYRGLTRKQAADAIGVDPCSLSSWEVGRRQPSHRCSGKVREFVAKH